MKYVVLYETAAAAMEKIPAVFPEHRAHFQKFLDAGTLLEIGPFGDPVAEGSMAIFTTREAAEEFVRDDPFLREGIVATAHVRDWNA